MPSMAHGMRGRYARLTANISRRLRGTGVSGRLTRQRHGYSAAHRTAASRSAAAKKAAQTRAAHASGVKAVLTLSSMPKQRDEDDDWNRHAQQIEKNRLHDSLQTVR
jgi:hypothetical protein